MSGSVPNNLSASKRLKKLTGFSLEELLPHRGNMLLIDDVLEVESEYAVTVSTLDDSFPLQQGNGVDALIMVEIAAQTAGICNGLSRIKEEGRESGNKGWLVGVKRADFHVDSIGLGSKVVTRSENSHVFDILREVSCVVHLDDELIGEVVLQLIQA